MGVWITGDTHGNPVRLSTNSFYEQKEFSGNKDENVVVICGDFGLVWEREEENKNEKYWLKWLEEKPFTTVFVDGNHDNIPKLNNYPIKQWRNGLVNEIRPHVLRLRRGEVYTIEHKKFFAFGGASSHDISDGILDYEDEDWRDKAKALDKQGKYMYRIKGLSWWSEELPNEEEMDNGYENLERNNGCVDYIITHSPPASVIALLGQGLYEQDRLTQYLENIRVHTEYKRHFMGHMHLNKAINDKDIILYEQIIRIL